MPTAEVARTKRASVLGQIVAERYGYPNAEFPDREVTVNFPTRGMGLQVKSGGWLYPDIVVTEEPGHFTSLVGDLALAHEVTSEVAQERWAPLAKAAPLVLYVPTGHGGRAMRLCRLHGIRLHKLMVFRQRPVAFGIDIAEAYSGPDLLKPIMGLLPPALRPMPYRAERMAVIDRYLQPLPASRSGDVPSLAARVPDLAPPLQLASGADDEHGADHGDNSTHLPPPSLAPLMFGHSHLPHAALPPACPVGSCDQIVSAQRQPLPARSRFAPNHPPGQIDTSPSAPSLPIHPPAALT